jgi:hypothetical protein
MDPLTPYRLFRIVDPDGHVSETSFCPAQPLRQVRAWRPGCTVEPLLDPQKVPASADLVRAVDAYLDRIGEDDPVTRAEALALAASRPDIARRYLDGDMASSSGQIGMALPGRPDDDDAIVNDVHTQADANRPGLSHHGDDRRTCRECANLAKSGRCLAAGRGELVATARDYRPPPGRPHRCEGYVPGAEDPDRRAGRERWPGLAGEVAPC